MRHKYGWSKVDKTTQIAIRFIKYYITRWELEQILSQLVRLRLERRKAGVCARIVTGHALVFFPSSLDLANRPKIRSSSYLTDSVIFFLITLVLEMGQIGSSKNLMVLFNGLTQPFEDSYETFIISTIGHLCVFFQCFGNLQILIK